jgi:hypothetical protein
MHHFFVLNLGLDIPILLKGNLMEKEGVQIIDPEQIFEAKFSIEIL